MLKNTTIACLSFGILGLVGVSPSFAESLTLDRIKTNGSITIGYREASVPFSYLDDNQQPVGLHLDLCADIVEQVEETVGIEELEVNLLPINSSNRIPLVKNGTVDIVCGSTMNSLTRQEQVSFSVATFVPQPRWLVSANSGLDSASDLEGKTVVVTQGSAHVQLAQRLNVEDEMNLNIIQARDHAESFLTLQTGRAVAFMEDDILLAGLRASAQDPSAFDFLPEAYDQIFYGLMFAKDDAEFKELVDTVLSDQMASGQFAKTYNKWFMQPIPPNNKNLDFPMSDALKQRVLNPSDLVQ